jgi:hypothetical protein
MRMETKVRRRVWMYALPIVLGLVLAVIERD